MSDVKKYVVAVSGGLDSIVLLDVLKNNRLSELTHFQLPTSNFQLIVAHFDHGIRKDSSTDEDFARGVAGEYGLTYLSQRAELGEDASEEQARTMRYNFLRQCCKTHNAQLITAHHQDDLIETIIINLIRGTGWRGLVSLNSDEFVIRPFLSTPKPALLSYAQEHHLTWREDSTNSNQNYLRNYVRLTLLPKMYEADPDSKNKLLQINMQITEAKKEIATELQNLNIKYQISNIKYDVPRHDLIMWPPLVAKEVIYNCLVQLDSNWHPNSDSINRVLHFCKSAINGKSYEVSGSLRIEVNKGVVQFKKV